MRRSFVGRTGQIHLPTALKTDPWFEFATAGAGQLQARDLRPAANATKTCPACENLVDSEPEARQRYSRLRGHVCNGLCTGQCNKKKCIPPMVGERRSLITSKKCHSKKRYSISPLSFAASRAVSEKPDSFCRGREAQIHTLRAYDTRPSQNRQEE